MIVIVINMVLPPKSVGRLGKIWTGKQSHPLKAHNSLVEGTRVGEPRLFHAKKDIMQKEALLSTIH